MQYEACAECGAIFIGKEAVQNNLGVDPLDDFVCIGDCAPQTVARQNPLSWEVNRIIIPGLTLEMVKAWQAGAMAQDAFVGISADHREFIMTGILPSQWDTIFEE